MSGPTHFDTPTPAGSPGTSSGSPLPSRLREKFDREERRERQGSPSLAFFMLSLVLVLTVVGFLWWRAVEVQRETVQSAAPAASAPVAPSLVTYGIGVGSFATEEAAIAERDRLTSSTQLSGVIERTTEGGTTTYRVILGNYSTQAAAESAATPLAQNYVVRAWQVVPMRTGE